MICLTGLSCWNKRVMPIRVICSWWSDHIKCFALQSLLRNWMFVSKVKAIFVLLDQKVIHILFHPDYENHGLWQLKRAQVSSKKAELLHFCSKRVYQGSICSYSFSFYIVFLHTCFAFPNSRVYHLLLYYPTVSTLSFHGFLSTPILYCCESVLEGSLCRLAITEIFYWLIVYIL